MVNITMGTPFNWTREETFIFISLWSKHVIQQQLEGCSRNILAYHKIANDLWEAGYSGFLEQCRDKIKKLKGEYKVCDDRWRVVPQIRIFDAPDSILGPKHLTHPTTVVESLPHR